MLNDYILGQLESFLQAEGKKSLLEYQDSAADQSLDAVKSILDQIVLNQNRDNLLLNSARQGCQTVVRLLLDAGANKDASNEEGITALMYAASKGHSAVVEVLLAAKANKEAVDKKDNTALLIAVCTGQPATVEVLLKAGANKRARMSQERTALIIAALIGNKAVVELLLAAKVNKEAVDIKRNTALIAAAYNGHAAVVEVLLKAGANKEARNKSHHTALMLAVHKGHRAVVEELLAQGANKNATDNNRNTVLMYAVSNGNAPMVQQVLAAGVAVDACNKDGSNALYMAVRGEKGEKVIALLISYGANPFLHVDDYFINNDPSNPLAGYSEKILNCLALSEHGKDFCHEEADDTTAMQAIKAGLSKRCLQMSILQSIYEHELDSYQDNLALCTTARSINPTYTLMASALTHQHELESNQRMSRQRNRKDSRSSLSHRALNVAALNMFIPEHSPNNMCAAKSANAGASRVRFFSQIRERVAAKYQAALAAKQLVQAGDIVEVTAAESDAVLLQIEARLNQQKHHASAMNMKR